MVYEEIMSKVWGLETTMHHAAFGLALKRISAGKDALFLTQKDKIGRPATVTVDGRVSGLNVAGNVRVIGIDGVMSRDGELCSYGTAQISTWIKEANADPSIAAILLRINSGGGDVDGTEQLGQVIRASQKPVVVFVAGMAASAAYWVASQAKEIMMETATTSYVGSLGVLAVHVDSSKFLEKEGYKVSIIRADGSEEKALWNDVEGLSEELLANTKTRLNSVRETFLSTVKAGRLGVSDKVFSGKMFDGQSAVKHKLADRVGTYEDALGRAMFHARKAELNNNANTKNNDKKMAYTKLESLLGGAIPDGMSEETSLAIETQLAADATTIADLHSKYDAAVQEKAALAATQKTTAAALEAYTKIGVSAGEVAVLSDWYANAKKAKALGTTGDASDEGKGKGKKMSDATAKANEVYQKLHG